MKQNVKIAKQLVKLAKRLMATYGYVGTANDLAQEIYECLHGDILHSDLSFQLPSGAVFCMQAPRENEYCDDCSIVSSSYYDSLD